MFPFWSPDSRSIGFFTDDKLKRIELSGGSPVTICDSTLGRGGSWNQDGTIVAALSYNTGHIPSVQPAEARLLRSPRSTASTIRRIAGPGSCLTASTSSISPIKHNAPTSPDTGVFLASLDGKENRLLFHTLSNAIYASGRLLFQRENSAGGADLRSIQRQVLRRAADPE